MDAKRESTCPICRGCGMVYDTDKGPQPAVEIDQCRFAERLNLVGSRGPRACDCRTKRPPIVRKGLVLTG